MSRQEEAPRTGGPGGNAQKAGGLDEQHHHTPVVGRSYRVSWRRPHWADTTATKTKTFERAAYAHRYRDQLEATGAHTTLECRPVGPWEPCVGKGCR